VFRFRESGWSVEIHGSAARPFHTDQIVAPGDGESDVSESDLERAILGPHTRVNTMLQRR
jgi:hypothetical protein